MWSTTVGLLSKLDGVQGYRSTKSTKSTTGMVYNREASVGYYKAKPKQFKTKQIGTDE